MRWMFIILTGSALFATTLFSSCDFETVVKINIPKDPPKLVVNSVIVADSVINVKVTTSRHILEHEFYTSVLNANVVIQTNTGIASTLPFNEYPQQHACFNCNPYGEYFLEHFKGEEGVTYTLQVSAAGYETVTATASVPIHAPILKIEAGGKIITENRSTKNLFWVHFQDAPDKANFYLMRVRVYGVYTNPYTEEEFEYVNDAHLETTDPSISENHRIDGALLFKDVLFDGREHKIPVLLDDWHISPERKKVVFQLETLNAELYNYLETKAIHDKVSGDPFAQPVQVHNNIKNGFGIFSGYSVFALEYKP